MSLEDSMKDLASSNRELATALSKYALVVEKYGLKLDADNTGKKTVAQQEEAKPEKVEKKGPGRPAKKAETKAEPPADEDDGLDDEDGLGDEDDAITAPSGLTHDDVKRKLLDVKAANGGEKAPAIEIIKKFGYDTIQQVKEKHYEDIWVDAEKKLRELNG